MISRILLFIAACWCVCAAPSAADEPPKFRTDDNPDKSLPWFQLVEGEFPPENSGHAISGELIRVDHLERKFALRVDRNDSQDAGHLDLPIEATMLPYGSIYYHGAPAALQDVPLGTHLHGVFYVKSTDDKTPPRAGWYGRVATDAQFTRCMKLEDDFSHYAKRGEIWKVDSIDFSKKKLSAVLQREGKDVGKPTLFDLLSSTLVMKGEGFAKLDSIEVGQLVQCNLTWATLYGPGRVTHIWLDQASRDLSTSQQLERHRNHIRERGLPGWVDAVDDESQVVTITFFDGVDPALFDEMHLINPERFGWPYSVPEDDPNAPKGGIAVALASLMTYDPVNDRKGGNIIHFGKTEVRPGGSGVQIKVKCGMLLEGYRPKRIVRFYPAAWKVEALPREEQFHGRE